ncbi:hypothetical protein LCM00_07545 [Bacillus infantis]|uniref:hypothetical protein n=1 Tax=Bacillus infantis TaxID=324767 RepID=UPI001CD7A84D|nr:hypothetical protein [Bacillus infantis]MCA1039343.1 hypothetical protein [Bacillus infantis]
MSVCPACNGLENISKSCPKCGNGMDDSGKIMDFYDDYSAYMPADQLKLEDGYPDDYKNKECPHLLSCPNCGDDEVAFVKEQENSV